ncbi:MAG: hypothetical protein IPN90_10020 [Elusimicrobia bacterium]|nr:hypothetical protein [Elusimicrobiota bacterium]
MNWDQVEQIVCKCQQGQGPSDVATLAKTILAVHAEKGCCRDLLSVIGRLYTVVAEHAGSAGEDGRCL